MLNFNNKPTIVMITKYVDFRCGIDSLIYKVKEYNLDPFSNSLFVFINKNKRKIKMLYFSGTGFYLVLYRLEEGKFRWLKNNDYNTISYKQMEWLLDGLDIIQKHYNKPINNLVI